MYLNRCDFFFLNEENSYDSIEGKRKQVEIHSLLCLLILSFLLCAKQGEHQVTKIQFLLSIC